MRYDDPIEPRNPELEELEAISNSLDNIERQLDRRLDAVHSELAATDRKVLAVCRSLDVMTFLIVGVLCLILWRVW